MSNNYSRPQRPTIGFLIDDLVPGYQQALWYGAVNQARESDVNLVTIVGTEIEGSTEYAEQANVVYNLINANNLDGLIISTAALFPDTTEKFIENFLQKYQPTPMVSIAFPLNGIPSLLLDNYGAMRAAVSHLVEQHNRREIVFIQMYEGNPEMIDRYQAYVDVLAENNITMNPDLVVPPKFDNNPEGIVAALLDERKVSFDAIVAADDEILLPIFEMIQARGIRIPYDVSVVGFDDIADSSFTNPPLTTVRQPLHTQGRKAVELILSQIDGQRVPAITNMSAELIVRQSCGCIQEEVILARISDPDQQDELEEGFLPRHKERIINEIIEAVDGQADDSDHISTLIDAFTTVLQDKNEETFIQSIDTIFNQVAGRDLNFFRWQNSLNILRRYLIRDSKIQSESLLVENYFHQARVLLSEIAQRYQALLRLKTERQSQLFREWGQAVLTSADMGDVIRIIRNGLPTLDIPGSSIALYEHQNPDSEQFRLLMAFSSNGVMRLPGGGEVFNRQDFIPNIFKSEDKPVSLVVLPLFFREVNYGYVILEVGPQQGSRYHMVVEYISSATQNVMVLDDVTNRITQLETAADVSRAASIILDPDELIRQMVGLIRERFSLYYAGIFLVDETGEWAVLKAGSGEAGRQMLEKNWRLEVGGSSMIGRCVVNGTADIQLDVHEAPIHLRNPYLPETRSEMALPLISRGESIGALTIQSTETNAFTHEDTITLQTMANQIASSIQNTRLFNQTQAALAEIESTQRRYLEQAWTEYNKTSEKSGYQNVDANLIPLGDTTLPEVKQAMQEKRPVVIEESAVLAVPIMLRDQPIGALGFSLPEGKKSWSSDQIAVAEAVSEQFGLAAETLRLLDETQKRAARERLVTEITTKIRSTNDPEVMVQTTLFELREALRAKRAQVLLQTNDNQ